MEIYVILGVALVILFLYTMWKNEQARRRQAETLARRLEIRRRTKEISKNRRELEKRFKTVDELHAEYLAKRDAFRSKRDESKRD